MDIDDILDTNGALGQGSFLSREELIRQNVQLREALRQQQEENALLARLLAQRFDEMPEEAGEVRPSFPISDEAIDLFEALPVTFTLEEALDVAERIGQRSGEGAQHLRTYLDEEMVVQEGKRFAKTSRKPYF